MPMTTRAAKEEAFDPCSACNTISVSISLAASSLGRSPFSILRALRPGGRYATVGGQWPRLLQIALLGPLIAKVTGKRLRVVALKPNQGLETINDMFERDGLQFLIEHPVPLSEVPRALQRFGEARHVGKIVISVSQ